MTDGNGTPGPLSPSAAARLGHQVRRALLLVAIVVGVVAAYWIWERFRTQEFTVTVVADADPHETLGGYPYDPAGLLARMEFRAWPSSDGPPLRLEAGDEPNTWTFAVRGDDRRNVKNLQFRGQLSWRGADNEGLSIPLSYPIEAGDGPGDFVLRLTIGAVEDFYDDSIVETSFKVTDRASGAALPGLRRDGLEVSALEETSSGIYQLGLDASTLLDLAKVGIDTLTFHVAQDTEERAAERLSLSVPLAWLFQRPAAGESRVLAVDFVTEIDALCPRATGLRPERVRRDQWPDRLIITGEFLDRTVTATLRHRGQTIPALILQRTPTRLDLTTSEIPAPGRYEIFLAAEDCPTTTGGRFDVIAPSSPLQARPLASPTVERGQDLSLRWRRGSIRDPLVVEVSGPGGGTPWRSLGQAGPEVESHQWPAVDLDPGSYRIRLRPEDATTALASWDLVVTAPRELLVVLHFADGNKDWPISEAWIDGLAIAAADWQATGSHARVHLALGEHVWVAKGRDRVAYTGSFVVESRHDFERADGFDLIRLDRAESRRRD